MRYTVLPGDTLYSIAREHQLTLAELLGANPTIRDENLVYVGQSLYIPVAGDEPNHPTPGLVVLSRADWGAGTRTRLGVNVARDAREEVYIHHTVTIDADDSPNEWETLAEVSGMMRRLQTIRPDLGYDIPYNFVAFVMKTGVLVLAEGRGLDRSGAHTSGHNKSALGVSFAGDFENKAAPAGLDTHLKNLGLWLGVLKSYHGFTNLGRVRPADRAVFGHRDQKSTACPGRHIYERLKLVAF